MTSLTIEYIGGFFDGDGYVYREDSRMPKLGFVNTNRTVLERIQQSFGGKMSSTTHQRKREVFEICVWRQDEVYDLADSLVDHTFVRRERLDVISNHEPRPFEMSWQYVAGFFDADGSIYQDRGHWRLKFTNTNREILVVLKEFLNATTSVCVSHDKHKNTVYCLTINRREDVVRIANEILPYCIVKRVRMEELLK